MGRSVAGSIDSKVSPKGDLTNSLRMNRPFGCDQLWPLGAIKDVVQSSLAVLDVVNEREGNVGENEATWYACRGVADVRTLWTDLACKYLHCPIIPYHLNLKS